MSRNSRIVAGLVACGLAVSMAGCSAGSRGEIDGRSPDAPSYGSAESGQDEADVGAPLMDQEPPSAQAPSLSEDEWLYSTTSEEYDTTAETPFIDVLAQPLSTFSSDVDTASYSNMRRFITRGETPEGIRIEELVNYFDYDYPAPSRRDEIPFSVTTQVAPCPWSSTHQLAMVGVQGAKVVDQTPPSNIVFLIDVSGSMSDSNKLPLLKESFKLLIEKLGRNDKVSIVTYAGDSRVVANAIPGDNYSELANAIDSLTTGGSTNGAEGIRTAYELASNNFIEGGNNRVILATDGDFNVGITSDSQLQELIEARRDSGIYISVLGFGMYNLKDSKMETIADYGNGNYAYIDTLAEARKVLVNEFNSTMFVIAQDLKLQVEFNPATVAQYRLVGYNNRRLADEDFNNDAKDAGDIGAGHSVTAFYELIPAGSRPGVDPLKYQSAAPSGNSTDSTDFMTVKVRYKNPGQSESALVEFPVEASAYTAQTDQDFAFASAVAELGLILTDSAYSGTSNVSDVIERASASLGEDPYGLRAEFVDLARAYRGLMG